MYLLSLLLLLPHVLAAPPSRFDPSSPDFDQTPQNCSNKSTDPQYPTIDTYRLAVVAICTALIPSKSGSIVPPLNTTHRFKLPLPNGDKPNIVDGTFYISGRAGATASQQNCLDEFGATSNKELEDQQLAWHDVLPCRG